MYDLNKRSYFTTLGELRELLAGLPDDTEVCTCGALGSYIHFEENNSIISFDTETLNDGVTYPELDDEAVWEQREEIEDNEYSKRITRIEEGWQVFVAGNKLMRTFLADGGTWDYELYDIRLTPVDSGQIGEAKNMTREEVTRDVLSWNHLENKERNYFAPSEDFVELCEAS